MKKIKVLILDIDGTIAGKSNQISSQVKDAIQQAQAKGIKVGLATGRMYCSALKFHEDIGADLPIISYNGAWMQNPLNAEMLLHQPIQKDIAYSLLSYLRDRQQDSDLEIHLYFDDQLYVEKFTDNTDFYIKRSGIGVNLVDDFTILLNNHPTKLLAISDDSELISLLLNDLKQRYSERDIYVTQSNPVYLEATYAGVNKGATVKYLVEKILGLSADQVMAIGDNFNDYTMLEYAGIGVAMGSAPLAVQEMADIVTGSVEEDGVAETIAQLLL
jgi:hypothetical protein